MLQHLPDVLLGGKTLRSRLGRQYRALLIAKVYG